MYFYYFFIYLIYLSYTLIYRLIFIHLFIIFRHPSSVPSFYRHPNSTIFSTILTNRSEIGPVFTTCIQISSWCAYNRPRNTRARPDSFCNSAMEVILVILKMASGYPLASFLHERCTANRSRTVFTWWCARPNVVAFIWTVTAFIPPYTCIHLHFLVPIKLPVNLSERCISHSTMIELLTTSTDIQISKGVKTLKRLFLKKTRIQFLSIKRTKST